MVWIDPIINCKLYNDFEFCLNKSLVSWKKSFGKDVRPSEPVECRALELLLDNSPNRIIIRDINSRVIEQNYE